MPIPSTSSFGLPIRTGSTKVARDKQIHGERRDGDDVVADGAHAGGPNTLRVLRIAMNTDDKP